MKETISKYFFSPIWKCEEIESELERLEREGWRLDKISGFRKFHFTKAQPKDTKYFFTCTWVKESGMIQTEQVLKSQYKASEIPGNFIQLLKTTSVYRITKAEDLLPRKIYRNIYFRHLVRQYIGVGLLFTSISVAGIALSCLFGQKPLWDRDHLFLAVAGFFGAIVALRHLWGWMYLRRQYVAYVQSNRSGVSEA